MISQADTNILIAQPSETLAEWWCILNRHDWPKEILDPEEVDHGIDGRRWDLMRWITDSIGLRAISRCWNKDMSDEDFDDFFRGAYEGDDEAYARYRKYLDRLFGA